MSAGSKHGRVKSIPVRDSRPGRDQRGLAGPAGRPTDVPGRGPRAAGQLPAGGDETGAAGMPSRVEMAYGMIQRSLYAHGVSTVVLSHAESLSRLGYALSDPTRVQILLALREAPAVPSDLADVLGVTRQVMSNHLACLRGCGLVEAARDGRHAWYRLADPHLAPALDELLRVVLVVDPGCCAGNECSGSRS